MRARKLRVVLVVIAVVVGAGVIGTWTGRMYAERRDKRNSIEQRKNLDALLDERSVGVDVGKEFPAIPVWSAAGDSAWYIPQLLPQGGVVFYIQSQCAQCVEAATALAMAAQSVEMGDRRVILLSSSDPDEMIAALKRREVDLPLFIDMEDQMVFQHHVQVTRAYFRLASDGTITGRGTAGFDPEEYAAILRN